MNKQQRKQLAREQISSAIQNTLEDFDINREEILEEEHSCLLCSAILIQCPRCNKTTPIGIKCVQCRSTLDLDNILEKVSESLAKRI